MLIICWKKIRSVYSTSLVILTWIGIDIVYFCLSLDILLFSPYLYSTFLFIKYKPSIDSSVTPGSPMAMLVAFHRRYKRDGFGPIIVPKDKFVLSLTISFTLFLPEVSGWVLLAFRLWGDKPKYPCKTLKLGVSVKECRKQSYAHSVFLKCVLPRFVLL